MGATGQVVFAYRRRIRRMEGIWSIPTGQSLVASRVDFNSTLFVKGIDPVSGTVKFTVPLLPPQSASSVYAGPFSPIIAGDGFAYYGYLDNESADGIAWVTHLMLLRVDSSGNYTNIDVADSVGGGPVSGIEAWIATNADQGVMVNWLWDSGSSGMALVNGTNVSLSSAPTIPGQMTMTYNILQAQDGSFIGTADVGDDFTPYIVNFDASGNVRWSVPNDQPQIATADGGVIGQSGITYSATGSATGQTVPLTESWTGNLYSDGDVFQISGVPVIYALSYAATQGGNPSASGTDVQPQYSPQRGMERISNSDLTATSSCNSLLSQFATMGHVAVATLTAQIWAAANRARKYVYDGPSSNTFLDPVKFPGQASPGVTTVQSYSFSTHVRPRATMPRGFLNSMVMPCGSGSTTGSVGSQRTPVDIFSYDRRPTQWICAGDRLCTRSCTNNQSVEDLLAIQMDAAIGHVLGYVPSQPSHNGDSLGIGQLCFPNLR